MIEKINELSGVSPVANLKQKRGVAGFQDEGTAQQDGLAVSSFAREMASISAEMAKIPEIREEKVADLKKQIDEGTYKPDLNALAGRLIWAGINAIEE